MLDIVSAKGVTTIRTRLSAPARIALVTVGSLLIVVTVAFLILISRFQPVAREFVVSALEKRYQSDVTLGSLDFSFWPDVRATGENLTLRYHGRKDLPPMVVIRRFTIHAQMFNFFRNPKHIDSVTLEGLELHIPPKSARTAASGAPGGGSASLPFVLDEVIADGAMLETLPADPSKQPLVYRLDRLRLRPIGKDLPMSFQAEIENAKPPGLIHSDGSFGPWDADAPSQTAVSGKYTFRDADLSVFKGITGKLASDGSYQGQLAAIEVHGTADVPDFALTLSDHAMPLHTEFTATVDGTNGDTMLDPVRARLGNSSFEVRGSIERGALERHKEIDLKASGNSARIEDFLRLALKGGKPPMTGALRFDTGVKIPPGEAPVVERLQLAGTFGMSGVRFTSPDVEGKIATISHYGLGNPKDTSTSVSADFDGRFHLADGTLSLPQFRFKVPGAEVDLAGTYALVTGAIDFNGTAKLDAKVSQMTTGWKSALLRPVDHMFAHDGAGVDVPIGIAGTRGSPTFKIDLGAILRRF